MTNFRSNVVFESRIFSVSREKLQLDDGRVLDRDIVRHPGAVVILPILNDGRICLIENYRISVDEWLIELPAGTLEPGEPPLATALRELTEETGYRAMCMESLTSFFSSPGIFDEQMHVFLATGLTPGERATEEGEQIRVRPTPFDETIEMIRDGRIHDGKTVSSILYYEVFLKKS